MTTRRSRALFAAVALSGAALDFLTKGLAFAQVPYNGEVRILPGLFSFGHALNPGTIWSFLRDFPSVWRVISILAVPALIYFYLRVRGPIWVQTVSWAMVLGGAIGNAIDRVFWGAVRDFIKFYVVRADGTQAVWPLFNLADSCIVVGTFLLAVDVLTEPRRS